MDGTRKLIVVFLSLVFLNAVCAEEAPYQASTTADPEIGTSDLDLLLKPLRLNELVIETEAWLSLLQAKVQQISLAEIKMREKGREISENKERLQEQIQDIQKGETAPTSSPLSEARSAQVEHKIEEVLDEKAAVAASDVQDVAETVIAEVNAAETPQRASEKEVNEKAEAVTEAKEKFDLAVAEIRQTDLAPGEKIKRIAAAELELRTKVKEQLLAVISRLLEEQTALTDRARIVVAALKDKGGEVEEYEQYLAAVSGLTVDISDFAAARAIILGWLKSPEGGLRWAKNILAFVVIVVLAKVLSVLLGRVTRKAVDINKNYSDLLRVFLVNIVRKTVFVVGLVVALSMLGINVGPLVAGIGALGFIVGFALQGTLGNFAAGLMILTHRPYDVGDVVETAGIMGFVQSMNLNTTTIKTFDNQVVVVPNGSIWGNNIINVTGSETRRVDLVFGIGYADDIAQAQAIMERILESHPLVLKDPAPVVKVHELGDSSVNFVCRPWTKTSDYWTVHWDVTRAVKECFDAEGVSIPFPQRDIHLIPETAAEVVAVQPEKKHETTITEITHSSARKSGSTSSSTQNLNT